MHSEMEEWEITIEKLKAELDELKLAHNSLKKAYEEGISKRLKTEESSLIKDWAIESAINAMAISDLEGKLTYVNPAFYKLWGYSSPDEVIGKPAVSFWHTGDKASEVVDALHKYGGWTGELTAFTKSGEKPDIQVSASLVKDIHGQPVCMLASFSDISGRKHSEIVQAENEISYRQLFNNVADSIYIQDSEGTFLDVNDGAVKMYGYSREELVGKNPLFVAAPGKNDMEKVASIVKRAYEGEPQQFEFWGIRSNGEIFPKEVRAVSGTYLGKKVVLTMAQDITKRKKAEIALQESERRFRELIELAVDGILLGSPDGIIIGANTYMQNITGRPLNKLIGIRVNELFSPNALKDIPLRYDLLMNGETVFSERDILRPDGTTLPIEMHTKRMPDGTYQSIYHDVTERKKAEETLRESESKFKSLVESTSDMIWETNIDGLYTYVSPQFENLLGYTFEETLGKSPFFFIADNNISKIIKNSDAIVEKAIPFNSLVNKYKHRNGDILYFETSGVPVYNPAGKLSGYRGVSRDITKRYHAEKELHKLSMVVQQSPNTVIITNLGGEIEYINPAGCTISGYTSDELAGRKPSIFSSGNTPTETYRALWKTLKSGNEWKGIFHNKKKTGELYWESAFIIPLRDKEGNITNYLGVKEDITDKLQSETALVESEERYRQLFESSPDAIILADAETGMLIDANTAACLMLGRTLEEIKHFHQTMLHPPKKKEIVSEMFHEHVASSKIKELKLPIESSVLRSDGCEIPVEVLASSITIAGKQVLQGVFRDITERKLAREELLKAKEKAEASDKLKSAFLNNISHELRTPLNGIIGFSEMITQMDNTAEDRLEFSKMIKRSSARLVNTITSYMDISMLVSGNTEINKRSFSLNNFIDKIHHQTVESCQSRNLALNIKKTDIDNDVQILTDENLLTKIFSHLLDNAIKFTKEGSITIGYEKKQSLHQFSVSDTGKGISKDALSVIFEIFMQADLSTSRGHEGSGLGLSIAQGFVKLLGGNMWVESDSQTGSSFFFTIPEKADAQGSQNENEMTRMQSDLKQHVVLIAEDEDSNFKYLEIVLKKAMYKVLRANDGIEAVEKCRTHPEIDILLLDLKMPGMDGFEAAKRIRNILPHLPVIALSAYVSYRDEEAAMQAGCTEYVVKPISKTRLLETIARLLRKGN